ncbi:MAG TPA: hypothetical protein VF089_03505 [Candidatus Binatia bacterium]
MKKPAGDSALFPSPSTGRTKVGVMALIGPEHPYPNLSPSRGKEIQIGCGDMLPFPFSGGQRKIMNHFEEKPRNCIDRAVTTPLCGISNRKSQRQN